MKLLAICGQNIINLDCNLKTFEYKTQSYIGVTSILTLPCLTGGRGMDVETVELDVRIVVK